MGLLNIKTFDIVYVDFGKPEGSVQGGIRPCVVVQNDVGNKFSSTSIVMPLTSVIKKIDQPTHGLVMKDDTNGLTYDSMIIGEQMRVVGESRIKDKIGYICNQGDKDEVIRVYLANLFGSKKVKVEVA